MKPLFFPRLPFLASIILLVGGCGSSYQVVLNDNVLYSPYGEVTPTLLSDANLQGCLNQVFTSSGNDDPEAVTLLACPASGVRSLSGMQKLSNLEQLELSDNTITDLSPLQNLKKLRVLSIRNNDIRNVNPLMSLPILRFVALQGNTGINCKQLDALEDKIGNTLNRPASCNK